MSSQIGALAVELYIRRPLKTPHHLQSLPYPNSSSLCPYRYRTLIALCFNNLWKAADLSLDGSQSLSELFVIGPHTPHLFSNYRSIMSSNVMTADDIAIVGLSFNLPAGVNDEAGLLHVLASRQNLMTGWPESRLNLDAFYHADSSKINKVISPDG